MIFSGRDLSDSNNSGYNDGKGFLAVYESAKCDLTVASLVAGGNVESFEGAYYTITGQRDFTKKEREKEEYLRVLRSLSEQTELPLYFGGAVERLEDLLIDEQHL